MKKLLIIFIAVLCLGGGLFAQQMKVYNNGEIDYVPLSAKFKLFGEDFESSLERLEYSINGEPFKLYTGPISLPAEGRYIIAYRALDKTGNISTEKVYSCIVDNTAPYGGVSAKGTAYVDGGVAYGRGDTAIAVWGEDLLSGVSAIYVNIDNSGFVKHEGASMVGYIHGEGKHKAEAYGVDNVGNKTLVYYAEGYIDNTAPRVEITPKEKFVTLQGENFTNRENTFSVSAYDNTSGVKELFISIDGGDYFTYVDPIKIQWEGKHTIKAKALDYLNNESSPLELSFYVDVKIPRPTLEVNIE
ncbi:MAG: hypothetical protein E4H36_10550 [Spirochaetales bacterium]|nr:MAG: hypothetical protein E4H36_10550 [Spirochaetales bacterium]